MKYLKAFLSEVKSYIIEVFRRLQHACRLFKKRLLPLIVKSKIDLPDDFIFEEKKSKPRGRKAPNGKYYSHYYEVEFAHIPQSIIEEIRNYNSLLRLYFGGDYLISQPQVWRNEGLPNEFSDLDIYSQVWHYDKVVDFRNIQLFTLLSDTTEAHGAFQYIRNSSEYQVIGSVLNRDSTQLSCGVVDRLTGKRGNSLLFSTGSIPHRAGIPEEGNIRDMFSICFFPAYTNIGINAREILK